jgi:hypothetical protein
MSKKRLHIHSLPILTLAIVLTGVLAAVAVAEQGNGPLSAMMRPSLRIEPAMGGAATLSPNSLPVVEAPGAANLIENSGDAPGAITELQTIGLQLVLDQSVE